jgi:hypothetical protein
MVVGQLTRRIGIKREVQFDDIGVLHGTATAVATIAGATLALPTAADARWGGWHGGGWHGGGRGGGGWGWGFAPGFALGLGLLRPLLRSLCLWRQLRDAQAAGDQPLGHRVWRWVRVCY